MMRDTPAIFKGRFARADIHVFVNLHGVGADNLGVDFWGSFHGHLGLSSGSGSHDGDEAWLIHLRKEFNSLGEILQEKTIWEALASDLVWKKGNSREKILALFP